MLSKSKKSLIRNSITCDETEGHGKLGGDLCDEVASQAAGMERGVLHEEEHGIRYLHQLALTQI